jgi:hypothetical protein
LVAGRHATTTKKKIKKKEKCVESPQSIYPLLVGAQAAAEIKEQLRSFRAQVGFLVNKNIKKEEA